MLAIDIFNSVADKATVEGNKVFDALLQFMRDTIKSTRNLNTWFVLKRGYISQEDIDNERYFDVYVGKEYENSVDSIVDLIHTGFFPDKTVFAVCTRMLSRDNNSVDEEENLKKMFQFYVVNGTIFRPLSFDDLASILDGCENDIVKIGLTLDKRAAYDDKISKISKERPKIEEKEEEYVVFSFDEDEWNVSPLAV